MTLVTGQKLTLQEYLSYVDGTDTRYELVDGNLIPMSLGTGKHGKITKFLERTLDAAIARSDLEWTAERFSIGVQSPRGTRWDTCRILLNGGCCLSDKYAAGIRSTAIA